MKIIFLFFCFVFFLYSNDIRCQDCAWDHGQIPRSLNRISCLDDFSVLQISGIKEGHSIKTVKVSYQISSQELYFFDTKIYFTHFEFCRDNLNYKGSHSYYNNTEYTINPKRSYYNFILSYIEDMDLYTFEFFPDDQVPSNAVVEIYKALCSKVYFSDKLRFLPTFYNYNTEAINDVLPSISLSEIYNFEYSVLNGGKGTGILTRYEKGNESDPLTILLIDVLTNDIPPTAGVISTVYQPPLSHINVLCMSRGIPNISISKSFADASLERLIGEWVFFEANDDKYSVRIATEDEIQQAKTMLKPNRIETEITLDSCKIYQVESLSLNSVPFAGRKASCFSELSKVRTSEGEYIQVPENGCVIPFFFYDQHIKRHGIYVLINELLADSTNFSNKEKISDRLSAIRSEIIQSPIDSNLIKLLDNYFSGAGIYGIPMRFRSSSNAEDALFFSGAGLYDSRTGIPGDSNKSVEKAIKYVWASLWNDRAFYERLQFGIDQNSVRMGVLIHRSFPDENANGVAFTGSFKYCTDNGFYINVRSGDNSVVRPENGVTFDEIYLCKKNRGWQIYKVKEESPGKSVLTDDQLNNLAEKLEVIQNYFLPKFEQKETSGTVVLDIEFKLDRNGKFYFKQVRPFLIRSEKN